VEVCVLGSGTGYPSLTREPPGLLIRVGDHPLLFDAGSGTLGRLMRAGVKLGQLQHIHLTHKHSDHCADLVPILQACRLMHRTEPLYVIGSEGLLAYVDALLALHPWVRPETYSLHKINVRDEPFNGPAWTVAAIPSEHTADSLSFSLKAEDKKIVCTGDAAATARLAQFSEGADLLIAECSFPDEFAKPYHLSPADIGPIAEQAGVRHLLLTHFYPECEEADVRQQVSKWYSGPVTLAYGGLRLDV